MSYYIYTSDIKLNLTIYNTNIDRDIVRHVLTGQNSCYKNSIKCNYTLFQLNELSHLEDLKVSWSLYVRGLSAI